MHGVGSTIKGVTLCSVHQGPNSESVFFLQLSFPLGSIYLLQKAFDLNFTLFLSQWDISSFHRDPDNPSEPWSFWTLS